MVLTGSSGGAVEPDYPVFPLERAPAMDGRWNGMAWENIPAAIGLMSIKTGSFVSMRQTAFKIGCHGNNLYIVVKCEEPEPDKIKFDVNNYRDGWYPDDNLEFFFSQDKSPKGLKQFVTNSRGARWCNFASPTAAEPWQSVAYKGADYWSVEIKIPFSQLGIGRDIKTKQFWFNLGRSANNNPDNEKFSCFAPVYTLFADIAQFTSLTFKDAPLPVELTEAKKRLDRLENWMNDRLWKIANVKEGFLVGRQPDDNIRQLLTLKQQAKKMLEVKNLDGGTELIKQYDKLIGECGAPIKRLTIQVHNRDANTTLYINGKEIPPVSYGKAGNQDEQWQVSLGECLSVIGMKVTVYGKNPGLRLSIPGQSELENRWRVGTAANDSWLTAAFDDRSWKKAELDKGGYLSVPEGSASTVCFRQIVLWGENHYSGLPCIQPKVREWGFSEKSMETLFNTLYSPLTFPLEDYEFVLDVPKGFSMIKEKYTDDAKSGKLNRRPKKITEEDVKHENQPYTRYRLAFESAFVQPNATQVTLIPLLLNEYKGADKLCKFYYRRMASDNLTEVEQVLPVRVLPPLNGRMPKKVMLAQYSSAPYEYHHFSDSKLFPEHFEAHMRQSLDVGFNLWVIKANNGEYEKRIYDRVIERGGNVSVTGDDGYPHHFDCVRAGSALAKLTLTAPEFRFRYFNSANREEDKGKFCRSYVTGKGAAQFKEALKKDIGWMLNGSAGTASELKYNSYPKASVFFVNYEQRIWANSSSDVKANHCFCDNCKKAFCKYAILPDTADLSDNSILKNYKVKWKAFREELEGRLNGMVLEVCNELGLKYMVYDDVVNDGYWSASRGKIDIVFPGWPGDGTAIGNVTGGTTKDFPVTQNSLDECMVLFHKEMGKTQILGQLFASRYPYESRAGGNWIQRCGSTKDGFLDAKGVKSQILRVVSAFHGGVDINNSLERCAGQFYYIGEATRMIAEYEDIFYEGKREDSLAESEQIKYPNLLVLTNGDERLILLFNETDKPLTVKLNNKNLKNGQDASIFESSEKISNPEKMSVNVAAGDVTAVHIK